LNPVALSLHVGLILIESDNLVTIVVHLIEEAVSVPILS